VSTGTAIADTVDDLTPETVTAETLGCTVLNMTSHRHDQPSADADEPPAESDFVGVVDLDRDACFELLGASSVGRLAVVLPNGEPIIRPVNYAFDRVSQSVVFRTGAGSKLVALVRAKRASFEVDGFDLVEHTGWSVILQGVTEEITDPAELRRLSDLPLPSWAPGDKPYWFRVRAFTVTGRQVLRTLPATPTEPSGIEH
jgi:uncharacterized protein